jgi:hypothetical protein
MRSKPDVHIGAHRRGPTRENQAVLEIFGLEDVARCHVDLTWPTKPVPLTVEVYFDVRDLRHEQIAAHRRMPACSLTQ